MEGEETMQAAAAAAPRIRTKHSGAAAHVRRTEHYFMFRVIFHDRTAAVSPAATGGDKGLRV